MNIRCVLLRVLGAGINNYDRDESCDEARFSLNYTC